MLNVNVSVKSIVSEENIIFVNLEHIFVRMVGIQKFVDDSVILCDKIVIVTRGVSTNVTNTISTNITSTVSINSDDRKVRYNSNHTSIYDCHYLLLLCKT